MNQLAHVSQDAQRALQFLYNSLKSIEGSPVIEILEAMLILPLEINRKEMHRDLINEYEYLGTLRY